jgi:hypothetical protein
MSIVTRVPQPEDITIKQAVAALDWPTARWKGQCFAVASQIVAAGLVSGTAVYGHYHGPVHPKSMFAAKKKVIGFCQHGWVLLDDGRIFDPTRWVFENKKPYFHIGRQTVEYDEGGNRLRQAMFHPVPAYDPDEEKMELTESMLPSAAFIHAEKLLRINLADQEPGVFTKGQVYWLANAPYETLQPHAYAIYKAMVRLGVGSFVPIDNRRRAAREAGESL